MTYLFFIRNNRSVPSCLIFLVDRHRFSKIIRPLGARRVANILQILARLGSITIAVTTLHWGLAHVAALAANATAKAAEAAAASASSKITLNKTDTATDSATTPAPTTAPPTVEATPIKSGPMVDYNYPAVRYVLLASILALQL